MAVEGVLATQTERVLSTAAVTSEGVLTTRCSPHALDRVLRTERVVALDRILRAQRSLVVQRSVTVALAETVIIIMMIIKLYLNTVKSGTAVPFTGV